ncbi:MAG: ATP-binding protein [Candidatus Omnitrophota bacterium]
MEAKREAKTKGIDELKTVIIRPGVSMLSVLRHLNYRPWFAIAEFVDNSLESFMRHKEALRKADVNNQSLHVVIEYDPRDGGRIVVRDNAAGIYESEYARAFRPAEIPPDRSGLAEFGMGMKSAACWFSQNWSVRTSALGENVERTVSFDISKIVRDNIEELTITSKPINANAHFTEITLQGLHRPPQTRTLGKIKEHLASIYRVFVREGLLTLTFDGEPLIYFEPKVLKAPYYKKPQSDSVLWRKKIDFDFGSGQKAKGFAALRDTASTTHAGFALFRRNRLIQGSCDEGYRPEVIFGRPNSYRYQRLFGELHLEGFDVSHTKDGFRWEEHEDVFLSLLKEFLDQEPLPLLAQAEGFRVRPKRNAIKQAAEQAVNETAEAIAAKGAEAMNTASAEAALRDQPLAKSQRSAHIIAQQVVKEVEWRSKRWRITIDLIDDPGVGDWLTLTGDLESEAKGQIGIRLSLAHPFMERFEGSSGESIEALLRLAVAIALSEVAARATGVRRASVIRRSVNEILRDCLSSP